MAVDAWMVVTEKDMDRLTNEELMRLIIEGQPQLPGPELTLDAIADE